MNDTTFVKRTITLEIEVPSDARFLTVGEDGSVRAFTVEPTVGFCDWKASKASTELHAIVTGWRDSLVKLDDVVVYPPADLVA